MKAFAALRSIAADIDSIDQRWESRCSIGAGFIPRRIKGEEEGVIERARLQRCTVTCMPEHAQQHDTVNKGFKGDGWNAVANTQSVLSAQP